MERTTIYCFIEKVSESNISKSKHYWVTACYKEGKLWKRIAGHISSTLDFARSDIGYENPTEFGKINLQTYEKLFPNGYKMEWVFHPKKHHVMKSLYMKPEDRSD